MRATDVETARKGAATLHRRAVLGGALTLGTLGLAGCIPLGGFRYELWVEIEVGGQRYSARGVRGISVVAELSMPSNRVARYTHGEAFWIDVPGKPSLFVVLPAFDGHFTQDWDPDRYLIVQRPETVDGKVYTLQSHLQRAILSPDQLPGLVYFRNFADPSSGEFLHGADMSAAYGEDSRVVHAHVSKTLKPITRGIKNKIPWLPREIAKYRNNSLIIQESEKFKFNVPMFYSGRS